MIEQRPSPRQPIKSKQFISWSRQITQIDNAARKCAWRINPGLSVKPFRSTEVSSIYCYRELHRPVLVWTERMARDLFTSASGWTLITADWKSFDPLPSSGQNIHVSMSKCNINGCFILVKAHFLPDVEPLHEILIFHSPLTCLVHMLMRQHAKTHGVRGSSEPTLGYWTMQSSHGGNVEKQTSSIRVKDFSTWQTPPDPPDYDLILRYLPCTRVQGANKRLIPVQKQVVLL